MRSFFPLVPAAGVLALACQPSAPPPAQTAQNPAPGATAAPGYYGPQPPPAPYGGPGYAPPPGYPGAAPSYPQPPPYGAPPGPGQPPSPPPPGPSPAPSPSPTPPPGSPSRPLLGPLVGAPMWQAETQAVLKELESNLSPTNQRLVAGIPLVFDSTTPGDINAFAGCNDDGSPFIAGTEGLLEAIDAISQTKATDELFGTQTYDAYANAVTPRIVSSSQGQGASAMLPVGIIPAQYWLDPRRISRAHEMFDEIVAFTFGHELSHHYLGHTGCAHGQPPGVPPAVSNLGRLLSSNVPLFNQPNEIAADSSGCIDVLDTGRARAAQAYRWTEEGGLWLLDFFARMDRAAGASPLLGFLRTHPNPGLRIPIVQGVATTWRMQHPG